MSTGLLSFLLRRARCLAVISIHSSAWNLKMAVHAPMMKRRSRMLTHATNSAVKACSPSGPIGSGRPAKNICGAERSDALVTPAMGSVNPSSRRRPIFLAYNLAAWMSPKATSNATSTCSSAALTKTASTLHDAGGTPVASARLAQNCRC